MKTHLTITVDLDVITRIRANPKYFQNLSALINSYLKSLIEKDSTNYELDQLEKKQIEIYQKINELAAERSIISNQIKIKSKQRKEKIKSKKQKIDQFMDSAKINDLTGDLLEKR